MVGTYCVVSVLSIVIFVILSNKTNKINWLSIFDIVTCCLVYFIGMGVESVFVIISVVALSLSRSVLSEIERSEPNSFVHCIGVFKDVVDNKVFLDMSTKYFKNKELHKVYNKKMKNTTVIINIAIFVVLLLTTIQGVHGH